jgi:HPt (histidine-containing phosphotransfer) domain-containing protein
MNDHMTKPLEAAQLQRVLQRWLPGWSPTRAESAPSQARAPWPAARRGKTEPDTGSEALRERLAAVDGLDLAGSLDNLGGRLPSLERVLRRFASTYRGGKPALALAASQGDAAALWQACHKLRGACAVMCATALVQRIEALEAALHEQQPSAAWQDPVQQLDRELVELARQLAEALAAV